MRFEDTESRLRGMHEEEVAPDYQSLRSANIMLTRNYVSMHRQTRRRVEAGEATIEPGEETEESETDGESHEECK